MSATKPLFGTQDALIPRDLALANTTSRVSPTTFRSLQNLVDAIGESDDPQYRMLRVVASHVSEFLGTSMELVSLDQLTASKEGFRAFLVSCRYKRNAVRSYMHYLRLLVRHAEAFGWKRVSPDMPDAWKQIFAAAKKHGCGSVVRYAVARGKLPTDFGDADLDEWGTSMLTTGHTYGWIGTAKHLFRRGVFEAGLSSLMPRLSRRLRHTYGVPIAQFPTRETLIKFSAFHSQSS